METPETNQRDLIAQALLDNANELQNNIDKNSEAWAEILKARDKLYRDFFANAHTDHKYEIDTEKFEEKLNWLISHIIGCLEPGESLSRDQIRLLIELGMSKTWQERTEIVHENIGLASAAITSTFDINDHSSLQNS
jgi:hypothetical protein